MTVSFIVCSFACDAELVLVPSSRTRSVHGLGMPGQPGLWTHRDTLRPFRVEWGVSSRIASMDG